MRKHGAHTRATRRFEGQPIEEVLGDGPQQPERLTDAQLLRLCAEHGISNDIPYSQLEAEAVRRDVDLRTVVRQRLIQRLKEAGVL